MGCTTVFGLEYMKKNLVSHRYVVGKGTNILMVFYMILDNLFDTTQRLVAMWNPKHDQ